MKKILLTGFEPFHKASSNPTQEIVKALESEKISGLSTGVLPVVFGESFQKLKVLIDSNNPDYVIALGQAEGRSEITPERIAINLDDARIADNAGNQPQSQKIKLDGPDGLFTTLPIDEFVNQLKKANIPTAISLSAGTYVCNHIFYLLQHSLIGANVKSGFVHVPLMESQASEFPGLPTMPLDQMVKAIKILIDVVKAI